MEDFIRDFYKGVYHGNTRKINEMTVIRTSADPKSSPEVGSNPKFSGVMLKFLIFPENIQIFTEFSGIFPENSGNCLVQPHLAGRLRIDLGPDGRHFLDYNLLENSP